MARPEATIIEPSSRKLGQSSGLTSSSKPLDAMIFRVCGVALRLHPPCCAAIFTLTSESP